MKFATIAVLIICISSIQIALASAQLPPKGHQDFCYWTFSLEPNSQVELQCFCSGGVGLPLKCSAMCLYNQKIAEQIGIRGDMYQTVRAKAVNFAIVTGQIINESENDIDFELLDDLKRNVLEDLADAEAEHLGMWFDYCDFQWHGISHVIERKGLLKKEDLSEFRAFEISATEDCLHEIENDWERALEEVKNNISSTSRAAMEKEWPALRQTGFIDRTLLSIDLESRLSSFPGKLTTQPEDLKPLLLTRIYYTRSFESGMIKTEKYTEDYRNGVESLVYLIGLDFKGKLIVDGLDDHALLAKETYKRLNARQEEIRKAEEEMRSAEHEESVISKTIKDQHSQLFQSTFDEVMSRLRVDEKVLIAEYLKRRQTYCEGLYSFLCSFDSPSIDSKTNPKWMDQLVETMSTKVLEHQNSLNRKLLGELRKTTELRRDDLSFLELNEKGDEFFIGTGTLYSRIVFLKGIRR